MSENTNKNNSLNSKNNSNSILSQYQQINKNNIIVLSVFSQKNTLEACIKNLLLQDLQHKNEKHNHKANDRLP